MDAKGAEAECKGGQGEARTAGRCVGCNAGLFDTCVACFFSLLLVAHLLASEYSCSSIQHGAPGQGLQITSLSRSELQDVQNLFPKRLWLP